MHLRRSRVCAAVLATLAALAAAPAVAATAPAAAGTVAAAPARSGRASLHLTIGHTGGWLGQPIPVTLSAEFRGVEGVTLEGVPQLKSDSVFTSDLAREPRQATEIVAGEPVLVATWSGTITPSTPGPLALSAELPVRIRYRDAPPARVQPDDAEAPDDPFGNMQAMMNIDPADPNSIDRVFQAMQRSMSRGFEQREPGRAHDEALSLKASSHPLEIRDLPQAGQPRGFSGAVGRFDIHASLPDSIPKASEPITLTVTVRGQGDLDRVDLSGIASSADWKAYPMTSKTEAAVPGKKLARRSFEQVLIPTHGGALTIPSITLEAFDPVAARYTSVATPPIAVDVAGPPAASIPTAALASHVDAPSAAPSAELPAPAPNTLLDSPRTLGLRLLPIFGILLGSVLFRLRRKRDLERTLHKTLEQAAKRGSTSSFFDAAKRLIVVHFAQRWHVPESEVTVDALRHQLGDGGEPLVSAMLTADALRFGRRDLEPLELGALRSSIEHSLRSSP